MAVTDTEIPSDSRPTPEKASAPSDVPAPLRLAFAPDHVELHELRNAVRRWVPIEMGSITPDALLASDEMLGLAIDAAEPASVLEINLRATHSIVVIEVTFRPRPDELGAVPRRFGVPHPDELALRIIEEVADRTMVDIAGRETTLRCTLQVRDGQPHESR